MMTLINDFKQPQQPNNSFYDIIEDWDLVESSLAAQYGLRIRQHGDMSWDEFCTLVSGIMPDTPLGQIVTIRSETDSDVIKRFNSQQRSIYNAWRSRQATKQLENPQELDKQMAQVSKMLANLFGKKGGGT